MLFDFYALVSDEGFVLRYESHVGRPKAELPKQVLYVVNDLESRAKRRLMNKIEVTDKEKYFVIPVHEYITRGDFRSIRIKNLDSLD